MMRRGRLVVVVAAATGVVVVVPRAGASVVVGAAVVEDDAATRLEMSILSVTSVAGSYEPLPPWLATMVHVPAATIVTVATEALPLNELAPTVQTLVSDDE